MKRILLTKMLVAFVILQSFATIEAVASNTSSAATALENAEDNVATKNKVAASKTVVGYCATSTTAPSMMGVLRVTFGTIHKLIGASNATYAEFAVTSTTITPSKSYPIDVYGWGGLQQKYSVWFDWNRDGDFDDVGETYDLGISAYKVSGTITVPAYAVAGKIRMRVRSAYYTQPIQACGETFYGQCYDFSNVIVSAVGPVIESTQYASDFGYVANGSTSAEQTYVISGALLPPASGFITVTPPANFEVSLTSGTGFSASPIAIPYPGITLPSTTIYTRFKPTAATYYSGNIVCTGGGAASTLLAVQGYSIVDYCVTSTMDLARGAIARVVFNGIDNTTGTTSAGYSNFTAMISQVTRGTSYAIAIDGKINYNQTFKVWFDWNHDLDFEDAGEVYTIGTNTRNASGTIAIPADALAGNTRMRVRSEDFFIQPPVACGNLEAGECEDYTVNVHQSPTLGITAATTAITATSATSGGNVISDGNESVTARGVCWGTSQNPTIALETKTIDGSGPGRFTSSLTGLSANTTYYVRAYATNSLGTSYGSQVSFKYATTDINLTDLVVPPISDVSVENGFKFTSNTTGQTVNSVAIQPGGKLDLSNPLIVSGDLTLKANDVSSFSANIGTALTVTGSVKYVKTMAKDHWYFISFPCDVLQSQITNADGSSLGTFGEGLDWDVEYYDGAARAVNKLTDASNWVSIGSGTKLDAFKGYIFWLKPGAGTVDVQFILDKTLVASEGLTAIPVSQNGTAGTVHDGWNLVGQPYLSKYAGGNANVNFMTFPNPDGGLTYTSVSKTANGNAGRVVDPFTAYFVQVAASGSISFATNGRQNAPAAVATEVSDRVQLNFTSATGADNTSLIMDDTQSADYQIGEDMVKWLGTGTSNPQVYTLLGGTNYSYNALPTTSVVNLPLGIYTKTAGTTTISADATAAHGISKLLLTDKSTGTVTDLLTSNYSFRATAGTTNTRFAITAQRVPTDVTETLANEPTIISLNGKLRLENLTGNSTVRVCDAIGRIILNTQTSNNSLEIKVSPVGMYNVQIVSGTNSWTKKTVVSNK